MQNPPLQSERMKPTNCWATNLYMPAAETIYIVTSELKHLTASISSSPKINASYTCKQRKTKQPKKAQQEHENIKIIHAQQC